MKLLASTSQDLTKINSLIPKEQKSFSEALLEYFKPFWKVHSLDEEWMRMDTSHYATESKPMMQVAVIHNDLTYHRVVVKDWEKSLRALFSDYGAYLTDAYVRGRAHTRLFNRAACFEFFDISKAAESGNLIDFMAGKLYDLIIVLDIGITDNALESLKPVLKEGNINRVFNFKE